MLYYLHCRKCGNDSGLLLKSELDQLRTKVGKPECKDCGPLDWQHDIEVKPKFAFYFGCLKCNGKWKWFTPSAYSVAKASRPDCPSCKDNQAIYFLPPDLPSKKVEKRKRPGLLDPEKHPTERYDDPGAKASPRPKKRVKADEIALVRSEAESPERVEEVKVVGVLEVEAAYRRQRRRQKRIDKHSPLKDERNPQKTSLMTGGRLVPFSDFESKFKTSVQVKGTTYPRPMKSGPTVVKQVRILKRSEPWDYREVAPGSFLRRLCCLFYIINFGVDERNAHPDKSKELQAAKKAFERAKEKFKPVEVQAMWAAGSLYISSNSKNYSDALLGALRAEGTVKALVDQIDLGTGGTYRSLERNFTKRYMTEMKKYKQSIVTNTERSYRTYFLYRWVYVFKKLRAAMACRQIGSVTIARGKDSFRTWAIAPKDRLLPAGNVFVVLPDTGTKSTGKFVEKGVHAEQLFYPIMKQLDATGRLTPENPAWVGGVKTACFTCALVLKTAADELGNKFMPMSDAVGNYWEASGQHVDKRDFDAFAKKIPTTIVFTDNATTINVLDTENPLSPPGSPSGVD